MISNKDGLEYLANIFIQEAIMEAVAAAYDEVIHI